MIHSIIHVAGLSLTVLVLSKILPGFRIKTGSTAITVAVVFSVINFFLGWLLTAIFGVALLVPALLTFGLMFVLIPLIVNSIVLWITDKFLDDFEIDNSFTLGLAAIAISLVNAGFEGHARHIGHF